MVVRLIWCTRSPDSPASGLGATEGVPINAPRPLPRPVRAMRVRLREQFYQSKQQTDPGILDGDKTPEGGRFACPVPTRKIFEKKCIDTAGRNSVSHAPGSEQAEDFY